MTRKAPVRQALEIRDEALYRYVKEDERVEVGWRALRISLDCSTAYTLLAWHHAKDSDEALRLHHQAVEAGERALEEIRVKRRAKRRRLFRNPIEFPEAVAYARSRLALGKALVEAGRLDEAIAHARAVFDANEDEYIDPLGASHLLIRWLEQKEYYDDEPRYWCSQLPESVEISDNLELVGREDFQVFGPWRGGARYELHDSHEF